MFLKKNVRVRRRSITPHFKIFEKEEGGGYNVSYTTTTNLNVISAGPNVAEFGIIIIKKNSTSFRLELC